MSDHPPEPLIELPPPTREKSWARGFRFVKRYRARFAAAFAVLIGALVVAGHLLGGIAGLWEMYKLTLGRQSHAPGQRQASPPPLMSVAILTLKAGTPGSAHERAAAQLTQDLTSSLERAVRSAMVASHGLASSYSASADPRAIGRDLHVRYLVQGDLKEEQGKAAVSIRLLDATSGAQLWSDSVAATAGPTDSVRDIIGPLTNRLRLALYDAERKRLAQTPSAVSTAAEVVLRADALWEQDPSPKGLAAARKLYEEALAADPGSTSALIGLFRTSYGKYFEVTGGERQRWIAEMDDLSQRAVRADRNDPRAWMARGNALGFQRKWDAALAAMAEALRIDPHRNTTLGYYGSLLIQSGRTAEALPYLDRAVGMDPRASGRFLDHKCSAHLLLGQYEAAIASCERAITLDDNWGNRARLVALYAQTGDMAKTEAMKAELLRRRPGVSIEGLKSFRTTDNPVYIEQQETHFFAGLRKAGIPEKVPAP